MNPHHRTGSRTGFTLIEIMMSLLIIGIGITAVIGVLSSSLDTSAKAHEDLNIVSFSDLVLNSIQAMDFDAIPEEGTLTITDYIQRETDLTIGPIETFTVTASGFEGSPRELYTVSYRLEIFPDGEHIKVLELQVWPGYEVRNRPRRFSTEIYDWERDE